jgi:molybdate transport system ATP-binding protein
METIVIDIEKDLIGTQGNMTLSIKASIEMGNLVVLFGDSGAGKTTLLRMLSGLTKPDKGYISIGDTVWFDSASSINLVPQKRDIGFMFQDYALFPNMTVSDNIAFAQKQPDKKQVLELLERFGLDQFANRKPAYLSGGQKQRVALARALARKPQLLLLDEPLSALDASMRITLQDEISKAHAYNGATTLLVSHDLSEVFRLAHKVLKISEGKVQAYGSPDEVFIDNSISGKVQITGNVVKIDKQDTFYLLTIVTGMNQVLKVTAFQNDVDDLHEGDRVIVYSKAFNPIVIKGR